MVVTMLTCKYLCQVIYTECDSDDEEYETVQLLRSLVEAEKKKLRMPVTKSEPLPPLSIEQLELKQICRLGDKEALKTFLANNPEINLDFQDPEGKLNHFNTLNTILSLMNNPALIDN